MAQQVIVDTHIHLHRAREHGLLQKKTFEVWEYGAKEKVHYSQYAGDLTDLLESLQQAGASCGVIANLFYVSHFRNIAVSELPSDLDEAEKQAAIRAIEANMGELLIEFNQWCCKVTKENSQLIPFIAMDPNVLSVEVAVGHLREMVAHHGAKGVKIHPALQGFYVHDPRMLAICQACVELDIPMLCHSGPSRGEHQYSVPWAFADTLRQLPDLRLILAHLGGATWRQTADFARAFPNVSFDCSEIIEWTGAPNAPTDHELATLIQDVGSQRVMMGSDFDWYDIWHTAERVLELPLLAQEEKEAILGANAIRILRI